MMNQKEKELFLQLSYVGEPDRKRLGALLESGAATPPVLGMLFANRMAGVAYRVLRKTESLHLVDREFRNSLSHAATIYEKINEDYLGCIQFVTSELDACGAPYALLKGAFLCFRYPRGCRTSNDIDVLVCPEDVGKVSAKLRMAGFRQGYLKDGRFLPATRQQIIESKMTRGETVPFIKEIKLPYIKYLEVDLNFSLDYKNSDTETLQAMLARVERVNAASAKICTLSKSDFLLHLCAHLYKEATTLPWIHMKRDMTFYKYCDIVACLQDFSEEDLDRLLGRAEEYQMQRELAYCLKSIHAFFGDRGAVPLVSNAYWETRTDLEDVIAPAQKKTYRYTECDPYKRFFARDRLKLLHEISTDGGESEDHHG